jgi:molecular chaperone Hsp33
MPQNDARLPFVFEGLPIRGELARLECSWRAILERRLYPPGIARLLGQAMAAAPLLMGALKLVGKLSLQIQSSGPLDLLVAECTSDRTVRGLARWREGTTAQSFSELCGQGTLAINLQPEHGSQQYQGVVELGCDSLCEALERYFEQSEQLPTRLWLAADPRRAAGMIVQALPGGEKRDPEHWLRIECLADTLSDGELLEVGNWELLRRLFHSEDLRLFDHEPLAFRCNCSRQRIVRMLDGLGQAEVESLLKEQNQIEVSCEFCGEIYRFDPVDAAGIFSAAIQPGSTKSH